MKRFFVLQFLLIFVTYPLYANEAIDSKISHVTLFSNQAQVTRSASLQVEAGNQEILFEVDAFNIDKESVQATVFGEGEMLSVQFKDVFLKEAPQDRIKELEDEIERLEEEKKSLLQERGIYGRKESFLNSIVDFSAVELPKEIQTNYPNTEKLSGTLSFLEASYRGIEEQKSAIDIKVKSIVEELEILRKELSTLQLPRDKRKRVIEIVFKSAKKQKINVEASYLVYNAFWRPVYKVTVPLAMDDVNLMMFASITQKSGEECGQH